MTAQGGHAQAGALQHRKGTSEGLKIYRAAGPLLHPPRKREREGDFYSEADTFAGRERKVFTPPKCEQMAPGRWLSISLEACAISNIQGVFAISSFSSQVC